MGDVMLRILLAVKVGLNAKMCHAIRRKRYEAVQLHFPKLNQICMQIQISWTQRIMDFRSSTNIVSGK